MILNIELFSGVLYRVRATYRYQKEDVDELSFDAGEIIRVIEYEDPEEQVRDPILLIYRHVRAFSCIRHPVNINMY